MPPGSGECGSTVYCGLDIVTGGMVALSEWSFKSQTVQKRSNYDRTKIEDDKLLKQVIIHLLTLGFTRLCFSLSYRLFKYACIIVK